MLFFIILALKNQPTRSKFTTPVSAEYDIWRQCWRRSFDVSIEKLFFESRPDFKVSLFYRKSGIQSWWLHSCYSIFIGGDKRDLPQSSRIPGASGTDSLQLHVRGEPDNSRQGVGTQLQGLHQLWGQDPHPWCHGAGYQVWCQVRERNNTVLTHWGLVTPYGVGDLGQHWFR